MGAAVLVFWRWYAQRRPDPDEITKVAIGAVIAALGPIVLAIASAVANFGHHKVSLLWAILFEIFDCVGFAMVYAIGMALFARAAPKAVAGLILGVFYLSLVLSNFIVGWVGGWLGAMPDTSFWLLHAAIAGAGAVGLFVARVLFHRRLAPISA